MPTVMQDWTQEISMMQQSVLLTAVRGPDGLPKYHPSKYLLRWYRRCILLSAMDGKVLDNPVEPNGGSFTGPSVHHELDPMFEQPALVASAGLRDGTYNQPDGAGFHNNWQECMDDWVSAYLRCLDEVPHHFQLHFMHGVEIIGYKHPDKFIREWWNSTYVRLVRDMHLYPEPEDVMDHRLGDSRDQWLEYSDTATSS